MELQHRKLCDKFIFRRISSWNMNGNLNDYRPRRTMQFSFEMVTFFSSNTSPGRSFLRSYGTKLTHVDKKQWCIHMGHHTETTKLKNKEISEKRSKYLIRNDKTSATNHCFWWDQRSASASRPWSGFQRFFPRFRSFLLAHFYFGSIGSFDLRKAWPRLFDNRCLSRLFLFAFDYEAGLLLQKILTMNLYSTLKAGIGSQSKPKQEQAQNMSTGKPNLSAYLPLDFISTHRLKVGLRLKNLYNSY